MGLADYYGRGALAAAQVLSGFDEARFRARLDATPIGLAFDDAITSPEGEALIDLLVRLLARLYPRIALLGPTTATRPLGELAARINPNIEIADGARIGIGVGAVKKPFETTFYAGAAGWDALLSATSPMRVGESDNPFGPGTAACLAAANVFRCVFLPDWAEQIDNSLRFSAFSADAAAQETRAPRRAWRLSGDSALVGVGAVGNAALWALARAPLDGTLHVIDPQTVELSNVQRYVLAEQSDESRSKVEVAAALPTSGLTLIPHQSTLAEFLSLHGYIWESILLGLDSSRDRRSAQASLPHWIANAWTQPGDLGVSTHPRFGEEGACVTCLYLPDSGVKNEDELVAAALNVPQLQMDVRTLLYNGAPLPRGFLEAVAGAVGRPLEALLPFEGRSIRDLYVEGFCGGAVIPLGEAGRPPQDLHVPLAHQSALAGVLLGAALVRSSLGADPPVTSATRLNVLRPLGADLAQPVRANRDGRCICDDPVFLDAYRAKYR
jgi:hypothetical protein